MIMKCFIHNIYILDGILGIITTKMQCIPNSHNINKVILLVKFKCFESMSTFEFVDLAIGKNYRNNNVPHFNKFFE